jgi:hypothetical protein
MENAKRTATDLLVSPAMDRAIKKAGGGDPYQFRPQFSPEETFILKGLEGEAQGVFKLGASHDLGCSYGLADYESLFGPTRADDTRGRFSQRSYPDPVRPVTMKCRPASGPCGAIRRPVTSITA